MLCIIPNSLDLNMVYLIPNSPDLNMVYLIPIRLILKKLSFMVSHLIMEPIIVQSEVFPVVNGLKPIELKIITLASPFLESSQILISM